MNHKLRFCVVCLLCLAMTTSIFAAGTTEKGEPLRTVVDHNGNEVQLPKDIKRIVISSIFPLPSVYCLFEGDASKLVGMNPSSMAAARNSILVDIMPDIVNVNTDFVTGNDINIEELLKLNPDVVFYSATNKAEEEMYKAAGIPAIAFSTTKWQYNTLETFTGWVNLLGEVLEKENTAKGIIEYGQEVYDFIQERLATEPELEKPKALVLFRYTDKSLKTSGSNFFGQFWIDSTGGENVAKDLKGMAEINMEQVYQWNPDIIYITNFSKVLPEDLFDNTISGHDWSHVKAVQEGKVYKFPLGMYRWFPPASETPLVFLWLAKHQHPQLFADINIEQKVTEYYKRFYNMDLTEDQLYRIFNPSRDAADE